MRVRRSTQVEGLPDPGARRPVCRRAKSFLVGSRTVLQWPVDDPNEAAAARPQGPAPPGGRRETYLRSVQGGARLLGERTKSLRIADGDVGEDLPIHFDA